MRREKEQGWTMARALIIYMRGKGKREEDRRIKCGHRGDTSFKCSTRGRDGSGCTFVGGHSYSTWFLTSRNLCVVTCGFFSFHYLLPHHS